VVPADSLPQDAEFLRQAFAAARRATERGDKPFGAVLVAADGRVLAEGGNTENSERDITGHAETNILRDAWREFGAEGLAGATMYASCEPCAMCAGTIYWSGVGRVVFGVSGKRVRQLSPRFEGSPSLNLSCRDVLAAGSRPTAVLGPFLEEEAERVISEASW
jgi:tRNA(Arg) A34 adenosine deaminase TadA